MKQLFLCLFLGVAMCVPAHAADYNFLTFQQADGTQQSFGLSGLRLTFSGGNVLIEQNGQTTTLPLAQLSKMFFSQNATAISLPSSSLLPSPSSFLHPTSVYSLSGVCMGTFESVDQMQERLPQGVYMMKESGKTIIIYIK